MQIPQVGVDQVPAPLPEQLAVLDVREQHEWDAGHIEGAQHIPIGDLPLRTGEVPTDRQVLVVCHVGARSASATAFLQGHGVDAVNLGGGLAAWHQAGRPMVSESGQPPVV